VRGVWARRWSAWSRKASGPPVWDAARWIDPSNPRERGRPWIAPGSPRM